jgi:hypothetical protein
MAQLRFGASTLLDGDTVAQYRCSTSRLRSGVVTLLYIAVMKYRRIAIAQH